MNASLIFAQVKSQYAGDSTMMQFVSKPNQAHTSTNGSLIVTSNKHK